MSELPINMPYIAVTMTKTLSILLLLVSSCSPAIDVEEPLAETKTPLVGCTGLPTVTNAWHQFYRPLNIVAPVGCSQIYGDGEPDSWYMLPNTFNFLGTVITTPPPYRADHGCSCWWTISLHRDAYPSDCVAHQSFKCGYGPGCAFTRNYSVTYNANNYDWTSVNATVGISGLGEGTNPLTGYQCWRSFVTTFYTVPHP